MAQPVKIRVSYREDAAFLLRLEEAIGKDTRQSEEWRQETGKILRDLSVRLLQAKDGPVPTVPVVNGARQSSRTANKAGASRS